MTEKTAKKTYTIDATNQSLGRVASQAAVALMGKNEPDYKRNVTADVEVTITNASKLHIPKKKKNQKKYAKYSGYPGGLRFETLGAVLEEKGYEEAIRRAVLGMLPKNRLQGPQLKNLVITD